MVTTEPINLVHKVVNPRAEGDARAPALVLIHGRGTDENDLMSLAPRFDPRLFLVSVRAPYTFPYGGYTWYNSREAGAPDPSTFQKSHARLRKFIELLPRLYAVDRRQIYVMGFSMGAVMAYGLGLTIHERLAGVIAHSGYVPETGGMNLRWEEISGNPFFVAHGVNDQVIPVNFGRRAQELLQKAQVNLTYREYPFGHEINEQSFNDFSGWLTARLNDRAASKSEP